MNEDARDAAAPRTADIIPARAPRATENPEPERAANGGDEKAAGEAAAMRRKNGESLKKRAEPEPARPTPTIPA